MIRFFCFGWAFLALVLVADPAAADPVSGAIFTFLASSGVAVGTATVLATFITQFGISVALSALSAALAGKPDKPRQAGIKTDATTSGGSNPQTFVLGRYATAGNMVAPPYSHPNDGSVPNEFLTFVLDVADLPGVAFSRVMVAGEYVEDLRASDGKHDLEGMLEDDKPHLFITWHDGHQEAADAYLMEHYSDHPDRPWSADMVGTGVAYAVLTFKYNRELFNNLPGVRFEVDGVPLYDPRLDSTVGGSGSHRWEDPATWAPSNNPLVMVYNILRGISLPDGRRWGGSVAPADLPLDSWFSAMNECDLGVALEAGGTEPQYSAGFEVALSDEPLAVIEELLKACSAEISEFGGVYKVRVGPPALPVYFFSDDDVVIDHPQSLAPYPGLDGVHNGIHATHPSAAALWETKDAPPRYSPEWEAEDGGRQLVASVTLPAVESDTQVQRLMTAWIKDERRFRRHSLTLPPEAVVLEPLDTAAWTSAREGYTNKIFEIGEISDDLTTCQQSVAIRERDAGDYVWQVSDEKPVYHPSSVVTRPQGRYLSGFALEAASLSGGGAGTSARPALRLVWDGAKTGRAEAVDYQVQLLDGAPVASGIVTDPSDGAVLVSAGILANTDYRARARLKVRRSGGWTVWATVKTADLRLAINDLNDAVWSAVHTEALDTAEALDSILITDRIDPIDTGLAALQSGLELQEVAQRDRSDALAGISEGVMWALARLSTLDGRMADAGIVTDPETGAVRIYGIDAAAEQISEVEVRLNAAEANLSLTATRAYVSNMVSEAILDPSQVPIVDDLQAEINQVRIDLDATEAALNLKATQTGLDGINARLSSAEIDLDGVLAQITLKADTSDFDLLSDRVNSAEIQISALDGASITQTVLDTRGLQDGKEVADAATLAQLLRAYKDREAIREDLAYATQDLRAKVDEDRTATASLTTALGVAVGKSTALIETERKVRASENDALASDVLALDARLGDAEGGLSGQATAQAQLATRVTDAEGTITSQAEDLVALDSRMDDAESGLSGQASAQSQLVTRVTSAEGVITSQAQDLVALDARLDDPVSGLVGLASAQSQLSTRVTSAEGVITSQGQDLVALDARLDDAESGLSGQATAISGMGTRVTNAEGTITSQAEDLVLLDSRLDDAESGLSGQASAQSQLATRVSNAEGTITSQAQAITTLETTQGENTTSISQAMETLDGIGAEYTLRIDNNGQVSGMVLRSDLDDAGVPSSRVFFQADKFAIGAPGAGESKVPFVVYTVPTNVGGVTVPAGVYIKNAVIRDGSIGRAKIADYLESDNYTVDGQGRPKTGMRLDFATGEARLAGPVISRNLVVAEGSFEPGVVYVSSPYDTREVRREFDLVDTGFEVPGNDGWQPSERTYLAVAAFEGGATAPGGITGQNEFWGCDAKVLYATRWSGPQKLYLNVQLYTKGITQLHKAGNSNVSGKINWVVYEVS